MKDMINTRRDSLRKVPIQQPTQQHQRSRYQRSHSQDVGLRQYHTLLERHPADSHGLSVPEEANGIPYLKLKLEE